MWRPLTNLELPRVTRVLAFLLVPLALVALAWLWFTWDDSPPSSTADIRTAQPEEGAPTPLSEARPKAPNERSGQRVAAGKVLEIPPGEGLDLLVTDGVTGAPSFGGTSSRSIGRTSDAGVPGGSSS